MNKRLFLIYTAVFLLIGLMLYLYRSSYNAIKVYINDGHTITTILVKLERLDSFLDSFFNNPDKSSADYELYLPGPVAYDSILATTDTLQGLVLYQDQRLRLDSLKRFVKEYQSMHETADSGLSTSQRIEYHRRVKALIENAMTTALSRMSEGRNALDDATALLDRWLVWMLVLAGSLITVATFYSFSFLQQRRRAESFSQTLLETTDYGIISFKPVYLMGGKTDYEVTYSNEAALKLLHIASWEGRYLSAILPTGVLLDVVKAFRQVIIHKTSTSIQGYLEFNMERNWLNATIAPLGEGVLVSIYNLNPMKAYEQKLTYKIKQLELANDELQQYAYVTSHDLQEPLRKIQMFSDMALNLKPQQDKTKDDYFMRIINSANHMRELIQTLLMFTRSTDQPSVFVDVDLNHSVQKVVNDLEVFMDEKKARVEYANLPVIKASEVHINLLFNNLITNSLKYSKPDVAPVIRITAEPVENHEYQLFPALDQMILYTKISVHDNGVGFQQSLSDKMFTIFQRLHNKDDASGTGIGLAICRKIVHQHHGFIYAEGKENEGASFYIFLPFEQPHDAS